MMSGMDFPLADSDYPIPRRNAVQLRQLPEPHPQAEKRKKP